MSKGKQKKKRGGGIAIIICIIVILALIGVIVYLMQDKDKPSTQSGEVGTERKVLEENKSVVIDENNVGDLEELLPVAESKPVSFTESMSHTWTFANGEAASEDGYVTNHTDNQYAYYFDVVRDDNKEIIYSSPVIPVGSTLDGIVLDKKLDKGQYSCTMECHLVEEDNVTDYSSINMILTIVVEN